MNAATDARDAGTRSTAYLAASAAGHSFHFRPVFGLCQLPGFLTTYFIAAKDAMLIFGSDRIATYFTLGCFRHILLQRSARCLNRSLAVDALLVKLSGDGERRHPSGIDEGPTPDACTCTMRAPLG